MPDVDQGTRPRMTIVRFALIINEVNQEFLDKGGALSSRAFGGESL